MIYMPHWPKPLGNRPDNYSVYRVKSFLNAMGNPERKIPSVVHITGTNGKGSTLAFLRYILQAVGYKVHAYTSPHLVHFNERILIAGSYISDRELHSLMEECRSVIGESPVSLFETATIAAFLAFSRYKADVTLIEVGMGGRLDSTNVVENTILSIITSISLDHVEYLGSAVELIAGEKAGIMRSNIPCIVAPQTEPTMNALTLHAATIKSPLYRGNIEWRCNRKGDKMIFHSSIKSIEFPLPSLLSGDHQVINAGNAIAACSILNEKYGFEIGEEDIESGLKNTYWPARLELIKKGRVVSLLPKNWNLFLDGAHNSDGAKVLSEWIKSNFAEGVYVIFGITREKNTVEFLGYLKPYIKLLCGVCVKSEPRATTTNLIKEQANNMAIKASECDSIRDAIANYILKDDSNKNIKTILICGSLFLARDLAIENSF